MLKQKNQSETPCIQGVSDWFRQRTEKIMFYKISLNVFMNYDLLFKYF